MMNVDTEGREVLDIKKVLFLKQSKTLPISEKLNSTLLVKTNMAFLMQHIMNCICYTNSYQTVHKYKKPSKQ